MDTIRLDRIENPNPEAPYEGHSHGCFEDDLNCNGRIEGWEEVNSFGMMIYGI